MRPYRFAAGALAPKLDGQAGMDIEGMRIPMPIAGIPMPGVAAPDIPGVDMPIGGMPIGGVLNAPALVFHDGKFPHISDPPADEFVLAPPTDVPPAE